MNGGCRVSHSVCPAGRRKIYGGKRCVFKPERNKGRDEEKRRGRGSEFQMVGEAKLKERRPLAVRMSGTLSRCLSRDLRFLAGM